MVENVYIIHGWESSPEEPVLAWLREKLVDEGCVVVAPLMPNPALPVISEWIEKLFEIIKPDENTVLIGHSIGCQAILRALEQFSDGIQCKGVFFIAPWLDLKPSVYEEEGVLVKIFAHPWVKTPIDFEKVKLHAGKISAIFSDDDEYVPVEQKEVFENKLGAKTMMLSNHGHFTKVDANTGVPTILDMVHEIIEK